MYDKLRKIREERAEDDRGFTLIELLVVVVIIGILIAIAIPLYLNYQKGAHDKSASSDLRGAVNALQQCYSENSNVYPAASDTYASGDSKMTFTCGGTAAAETANLSDGTALQYVATPSGCTNATAATDCTGFTLEASNSGGHDASGTGVLNGKKTYSYDSSKGGVVGP